MNETNVEIERAIDKKIQDASDMWESEFAYLKDQFDELECDVQNNRDDYEELECKVEQMERNQEDWCQDHLLQFIAENFDKIENYRRTYLENVTKGLNDNANV
jgi:FtsZ-binding cell division protein ZapB